jgi:BirA family transcriptional regulator, biotin operon repressor / biotin---[acetyl-CoA-carboxylase] ligase
MRPTAPELPSRYRLAHLAETDSTNAEAMRRALAGEMGPMWVLTDRQNAGRGRSGRAWASLPGNLHASLILSPACPMARAPQLALVAGVAAIDAIRKAGALAAPAGLRLKWPNDILIGSAKTGGILVESTTRAPGAGLAAVVGVGLNLAAAPAELGPAATYLAAHGLPLSPREALCFLAEAMEAWLAVWDEGAGFARVRAAWLERGGAPGEPLAVNGTEGRIEGRFVGLDDEGALLIVAADGRERRFAFGDVSLAHVPPGDAAQGDDEVR